jgi:hypothetical protein
MRKPSKKLRIHDYDLEQTMASNDDLGACNVDGVSVMAERTRQTFRRLAV